MNKQISTTKKRAFLASNALGSSQNYGFGNSSYGDESDFARFYMVCGSGSPCLFYSQHDVLRRGQTGIVVINDLIHFPRTRIADVGAAAARMPVARESVNEIGLALSEIKSVFGFSEKQLSSVLRCSRKSLDNWRKGTKPNARNLKRLWKLLRAAQDWKELGYPTAHLYFEREIIGGETLLKLLSSEEIDLEKVSFAGTRLKLWNLSETDN